MERISRILVPINGGLDDEEALRLACNVAKRNKAKITIAHVVEVQRSLPLDADLPIPTAQGDKLLGWAEELARTLDCQVDAELLQARLAGAALVDEALNIKADLIIMGLPYRTRFGAFYLSETSNYVLNHASCHVWLVRESHDRFPEHRHEDHHSRP